VHGKVSTTRLLSRLPGSAANSWCTCILRSPGLSQTRTHIRMLLMLQVLCAAWQLQLSRALLAADALAQGQVSGLLCSATTSSTAPLSVCLPACACGLLTVSHVAGGGVVTAQALGGQQLLGAATAISGQAAGRQDGSGWTWQPAGCCCMWGRPQAGGGGSEVSAFCCNPYLLLLVHASCDMLSKSNCSQLL
jgi:hypothetical protein